MVNAVSAASWILAKATSLVHRVRSHYYRRSQAWKTHPLNCQPPRDDWDQIDHEVVSLVGKLPFTIQDYLVDAADYVQFKKQFSPGRLYAAGYQDKKVMEHYISYKLLELRSSDVYIDVASENSPFPEMFRRKLRLKVYSQDLSYRHGVHGDRIGSSADSMPIAEESIDKVSLHCAFEHFPQDVDRNFVHELRRVLRPSGRCVIVPLYLASQHLNIVDPLMNYRWIQFDPNAIVMAETDLGGLFERYYSPAALERILVPNLGLIYQVFRIRIPNPIWESASRGLDRVRYALRIARE